MRELVNMFSNKIKHVNAFKEVKSGHFQPTYSDTHFMQSVYTVLRYVVCDLLYSDFLNALHMDRKNFEHNIYSQH
jgi:hypothetical protein